LGVMVGRASVERSQTQRQDRVSTDVQEEDPDHA
jgi:hypothetical protein